MTTVYPMQKFHENKKALTIVCSILTAVIFGAVGVILFALKIHQDSSECARAIYNRLETITISSEVQILSTSVRYPENCY